MFQLEQKYFWNLFEFQLIGRNSLLEEKKKKAWRSFFFPKYKHFVLFLYIIIQLIRYPQKITFYFFSTLIEIQIWLILLTLFRFSALVRICHSLRALTNQIWWRQRTRLHLKIKRWFIKNWKLLRWRCNY